MTQAVTLLGATGSIGLSTLDVIQRHPERYSVFALTAYQSVSELVALAQRCGPQHIVIGDKDHYLDTKQQAAAAGLSCQVHAGAEALEWAASHSEVDIVMAAIVGAAGLRPTLAAVQQGKRVLLANKEALVMSGQLFIDAVNHYGAELLPVDSEHNAIFQCLPERFQYGQLSESGISRILLTGSGGPFRDTPLAELTSVTPDQACAHPNWSMGRKISVDSATMMNKGLEFIEACWLFGLSPNDIEVVLHPQSVIHSMVQYQDGSVLAQLGQPDMRTPIAHTLAYPERIDAGVEPLNFSQLSAFSFARPDAERFPNLYLAMDACRSGQDATTALNASNELAVEAFLTQRIGFTAIAEVNQKVLSQYAPVELSSLDAIIDFDSECRRLAAAEIDKLSG